MDEIDEIKNDIVKDLACLLMEKNATLTMEQALDIVFNSDTYQKLLNDKTRLYYQSARYVFSYLQHELETGKVG
mgnify:FL=1